MADVVTLIDWKLGRAFVMCVDAGQEALVAAHIEHWLLIVVIVPTLPCSVGWCDFLLAVLFSTRNPFESS